MQTNGRAAEGHTKALTAWLRCRDCQGRFDYRELAPRFGVLQCRCAKWPVVDDIPIFLRARRIASYEHTRGGATSDGVSAADLVLLVERGRHRQALLRCLTYAVPLPALERLSRRLSRSIGRAIGAGRLTRLIAARETATARDAIGVFFAEGSPLGADLGDYFRLRAGQPRHLAALALLEQIPDDSRPILDLACGVGHFEHYFAATGRAAIGADFNFSQLWIARHWIAPQSPFVCLDLGEPLPFADDSMAAVVCSDAYHYVPGDDRVKLLREVERCAPGRMTVLTRVGNIRFLPNEGYENDAAGYLREIGDAHMYSEPSLIRDYLARRAARPDPDAASQKWISFVRNGPPFQDHPQWPHAAGKLGFNPIYERTAIAEGLRLRFEFPGIWYAYENGQMLSYMPRAVTVAAADPELLPDRQSLLERLVLVGLPERF